VTGVYRGLVPPLSATALLPAAITGAGAPGHSIPGARGADSCRRIDRDLSIAGRRSAVAARHGHRRQQRGLDLARPAVIASA